jgi:polyhydroxybutyrate depolymerase
VSSGASAPTRSFLPDELSSGSRPEPIIHLPPNWSSSQSLPLVVALHASGGTPASFEEKSGWDAVADANDFVVAYLGSSEPAWKRVSNVRYIKEQIKAISATYNIDPRRVYVSGFSAGAYISYYVACRLSPLVTAVAPVSGAMHHQHCNIARPISELTIFGTNDIIPLSGTQKFPGPAAVTETWRALDGCPSTPTTKVVGPVREQTWGPCNEGTAVGYYLIEGGTHQYPGSPGLSPSDPDSKLAASAAIWAFFAAHRSRG